MSKDMMHKESYFSPASWATAKASVTKSYWTTCLSILTLLAIGALALTLADSTMVQAYILIYSICGLLLTCLVGANLT